MLILDGWRRIWQSRCPVNLTAFFFRCVEVDGTQRVITPLSTCREQLANPRSIPVSAQTLLEFWWSGKSKSYIFPAFLSKCNNWVKRNKTVFAFEVTVVNANFSPSAIHMYWTKGHVSKLNLFICSLDSSPYSTYVRVQLDGPGNMSLRIANVTS